jgi:hypothetical protein
MVQISFLTDLIPWFDISPFSEVPKRFAANKSLKARSQPILRKLYFLNTFISASVALH